MLKIQIFHFVGQILANSDQTYKYAAISHELHPKPHIIVCILFCM